MHRPHVDDLDPCPNCGDPVWRTHRCKAPARALVPMPDTFRDDVDEARARARQVDELAPRVYTAALWEDVGL